MNPEPKDTANFSILPAEEYYDLEICLKDKSKITAKILPSFATSIFNPTRIYKQGQYFSFLEFRVNNYTIIEVRVDQVEHVSVSKSL